MFILLKGNLLDGSVNLPQVVDAGIGLRVGTGFHEVWNRNGRKQSNNAHNNHDFYQREAAQTNDSSGGFHSLQHGVNDRQTD